MIAKEEAGKTPAQGLIERGGLLVNGGEIVLLRAGLESHSSQPGGCSLRT